MMLIGHEIIGPSEKFREVQQNENLSGRQHASVRPEVDESAVATAAHKDRVSALQHAPSTNARLVTPQVGRTGFMAQHIAQEVIPVSPGLAQYRIATDAYERARDITTEVLPSGTGLSIKA